MCSKVLCIDDEWKSQINFLLELFDSGGQTANKSFVEIYEIHEQVVANDDVVLGFQGKLDLIEFSIHILDER